MIVFKIMLYLYHVGATWLIWYSFFPSKINYFALQFQLKSAVTRAQSIGCGKQFSPIVFYGSPCGIPPKKPTRMLWRMLREICPNVSQQNILSIRLLFVRCCMLVSLSISLFFSYLMYQNMTWILLCVCNFV